MIHRDLLLFIEQVIEQELDEIAKSPEVATMNGLALYVQEFGNTPSFTLYKPQLFEAMYNIKVQGRKVNENPVVGMIVTKNIPKLRCWELRNSAAEKGYGPLLYDIALSYAGKNGIMPDRDSVSGPAQKIWDYYLQNRKNDIEVKPVHREYEYQGGMDPGAPQSLNYRYILKNPIHAKIQAMISKHDECMERCWEKFKEWDSRDVPRPSDTLHQMAGDYFNVKYHGFLPP